jgi:predicted ATPase
MVEAARRLGPGFADGVRFVELAAVSAADLVAPAIAAGLGLSTSAGQLTADLQAYLRPRRLLLAVDNFEQVLTAAALLAGLLAAAPGLVVLATSRAVLRLSGEHEFAVPPLPIPPAGTALDPAGLLDYASVRLFTERAHAAAPDFQLTGDNAAAVAEICRRLDGLPLAIELAAARLRLLPPQALASRLGQRFSLLTGGPRDLPQRQQTLRNTLDWSFGLLSAAEQALFTRLGVFAGPFSLPAAEAIGADAPEEGHAPGAGELMDTLGSLVDSSLVRPQTRYGSRGSRCWRPSGNTRWTGCVRAASGPRPTTGTLPISWPWPSRQRPTSPARGSWRGWTGWRPSTTTCGPQCPGWWTTARWSRPCT